MSGSKRLFACSLLSRTNQHHQPKTKSALPLGSSALLRRVTFSDRSTENGGGSAAAAAAIQHLAAGLGALALPVTTDAALLQLRITNIGLHLNPFHPTTSTIEQNGEVWGILDGSQLIIFRKAARRKERRESGLEMRIRRCGPRKFRIPNPESRPYFGFCGCRRSRWKFSRSRSVFSSGISGCQPVAAFNFS